MTSIVDAFGPDEIESAGDFGFVRRAVLIIREDLDCPEASTRGNTDYALPVVLCAGGTGDVRAVPADVVVRTRAGCVGAVLAADHVQIGMLVDSGVENGNIDIDRTATRCRHWSD